MFNQSRGSTNKQSYPQPFGKGASNNGNASDISDDDCADVDEMMVISEKLNNKTKAGLQNS